MDEQDQERARALIQQQRELLTAVAEARLDPDQANAQYKRTHVELRALLAKDTLPCFCPWGSVHPWAFAGYDDWRLELDKLEAPLRSAVAGQDESAWRLILYRRGGDPTDLPFEQEFEESLSAEKWAVLDVSLRNELAVRGTELVSNRQKCHPMPCGGRRKPQRTVDMYKIREHAPSGRVVLRVFFATAPGKTIVLLHGYDKGQDDSDTKQRAESKVACRRLEDLSRQLDDATTGGTALETERT